MARNIPITTLCNQNCVYCAAHGRDEPSERHIKTEMKKEKSIIGITGGEPTLCRDLIKYIKEAKKNADVVELQTNGTMLSYPGVAKKLVESGADQFNVAMPSHIKSISDRITKTSGLFDKRISGIKNLLALKAKVRVTCIINNLNKKTLAAYARYVCKTFPDIYLLEFNFVKGEGRAKGDSEIIPRYKDVKKQLKAAADICRKNSIAVMIDHVPLCHMNGFEHLHADIPKLLLNRDKDFFFEKAHVKRCGGCTLKSICVGPRVDYVETHGEDVRPSKKNPEDIIAKANVNR